MIVGVVPEPALSWLGLTIPEFGSVFFQIDLRRAGLARLEPVHALVGDDVDAVLADREGVLDLLVERLDLDRAGLGVERPDLAVRLRDEPDQAVEVGQRRGDPLGRGVEHRRQVVVALERRRAPVGALAVDLDVVGLGRDPDPVLVVEEEVAAAGEVLVRLACRAGWRASGGRGAIVASVSGSMIRTCGAGEQRRADADDAALAVEGERCRRSRRLGLRGRDRRVAERALRW